MRTHARAVRQREDSLIPVDAERAVLGGVLLDEGLIAGAEPLHEGNFGDGRLRRIWTAIQRARSAQHPVDLVSVVAELRESGELESAGGPAFVAGLLDGLPRPTSLAGWAEIIRDHARRRRVVALGREIETVARDGVDPEELAGLVHRLQQAAIPVAPGRTDPDPHARAFTLAELEVYKFPPRRALLCRGQEAILREGHLAQIAALRGMGKTWLMQTLALVAASDVEALGIRAPEPCRVLYVDGEMGCDEVQQRFAKLRKVLHLDLSLPVTVVAADWQEGFLPRLDTPEGQAFVEPEVANADLLFLDNRSCLFDPEGEKDATAWQPAQDWLLSLRRRGKAVVTGHHANRQGTARGHSKAEDLLNLSLRLSRPEGYIQNEGARFLVEVDKARGIHGAAAAPFVARLTEDGWMLESSEAAETDGTRRKLREYVKAASEAGERPKSASAAIRGAGVNRAGGLRAWAEMLRAGQVALHPGGGYSLA